MAPPPWSLSAVEGVAAGLPAPAGLLLGAVDGGARSIALLGAAPLPADASAKEITAAAGAARKLDR